MTFDYGAIRDSVVVPQLANFGEDATLIQPGVPTGPEYDPTPGTPTPYAVKVLTTAFSVADRAGSLVQENDQKYLMSTEGNPLPDLKGTITIGGEVLQVIKLETKRYGGTVLFWYVYCRK